jgi:hypothetical protein
VNTPIRWTRQIGDHCFGRAHSGFAGALVCLAMFTCSVAWGGEAAGAAVADPPVRRGDILVVDPYKQSLALTYGSRTTQFSLRLPDGSVCPGDSANDQWRIQSFLIPSTDDPTGIHYGPIGPHPYGNGRYAMFGVDTTPFVHQLLRKNPRQGQPGVIPPMPPFSFDVIAGEHIPSGTYRVGAACTLFGVTKLYWDTKVVLTDPPDGKFEWRLFDVPDSVDDPRSTSSSWLAVAITGGATAAVGAALLSFIIWRRRSGVRRTTPSKEHS